MAHRFFIPGDWLHPPHVRLSGEPARQIKTVLRMQPGDEIIVLDNSGMEWQVVLTTMGRDSIEGEILAAKACSSEPALHLTLYQGTLKAHKFEWVLQKGTEIGISRFVPTICRRSIVTARDDLAKKRDRWERIIQEAAEQSCRGKMPVLEQAVPLAEAIRQVQQQPSLMIMPWEEASGPALKEILTSSTSRIDLFVGPEGGFTPEEAALARQAGAFLVKLGPRILRAETAGLAASSAIMFESGEWG